jgi:hypothetical protein
MSYQSPHVCQNCGKSVKYLGGNKYQHTVKGTGCRVPPIGVLREVYERQHAPLAKRNS